MEITFLGTACMKPTKERNHAGILLDFGPEHILFDCGEGIQRQFVIAGLKLTKLTKIFISHWHGDHSLGLVGLLQTISSSEYAQKIMIYGPKGTKESILQLIKIYRTTNVPDYEVIELKNGVVVETDSYSIEALEMDHGIETFGFRFTEKDRRRISMEKLGKLGVKEGPLVGKIQQGREITVKGKKIHPDDVSTIIPGKVFAYLADTGNCANAEILAKDADLLVTEATFSKEMEGKASEYKHLTAEQAGLIANRANAKKLVVTHFSPRYKSLEELEQEIKDVFPEVIIAFDFMKVKL